MICNGHPADTKDNTLSDVMCNGHQDGLTSEDGDSLETDEAKKMVEAVVESASADSCKCELLLGSSYLLSKTNHYC